MCRLGFFSMQIMQMLWRDPTRQHDCKASTNSIQAVALQNSSFFLDTSCASSSQIMSRGRYWRYIAGQICKTNSKQDWKFCIFLFFRHVCKGMFNMLVNNFWVTDSKIISEIVDGAANQSIPRKSDVLLFFSARGRLKLTALLRDIRLLKKLTKYNYDQSLLVSFKTIIFYPSKENFLFNLRNKPVYFQAFLIAQFFFLDFC